MPTLTIGDTSIFYTYRQGVPPVVLLHAGAASSRQWNKVIGNLDQGLAVIAPDFWGFGQTNLWAGDTDLTHDDNARLVRRVLEEVGIDSAHIVGHSYGGATAIRYALAWPGAVRSLTLIEPLVMTLLKGTEHQGLFDQYDSIASGFLRHAANNEAEAGWRAFIDDRNGKGTWEGMSIESRARFLASTPSVVSGYKANLGNSTSLEELKSLRAPVALACGEATTAPDRAVSGLIRDTLPTCRYHVIPGAGHMSPLTHPDLVAALIEQHIQRVEGT